jgi:hypothetical protein
MLVPDQVLLALDDRPPVPTLPTSATDQVLQGMADLMSQLATGRLPRSEPHEDDDEVH